MSSDAVQITIPDFDDDNDFTATPVFGRTGAAGLWGTSNAGADSPTTSTPVVDRGERSFFHARGDSVTSEDSNHSAQHNAPSRKFKAPFAHSAQSSVATTSNTSFSKKPSFASLRNAFKSAKSTDAAPPLPTINHDAYPVLRNPFNRSTSSLAHHVQGRPSIHTSPQNVRPTTPASGEKSKSKAKGHHPAKSQHSHNGSIFHSSDAGSDFGGGTPYLPSFSPPPVPPVPSGFGGASHREEIDFEDKIVVEAKTPSDFALHAIFIRFAARAEILVNIFVTQPTDTDPHLEATMGPGVDPQFDELLQSLGKVAQKHTKPVVDSLLRWRKSQKDGSFSDAQRMYPGNLKAAQMHNAIYMDRRILASIYLTCRALVVATASLGKDALSEALGNQLEELTFAQFRNPDIKMLTLSPNHRANTELYAVLLGNLANIRFDSVTDRFRVELGPVAAGQVPKDLDFRYEYLVKGLQYVRIHVWPPESFEEGAEFLDSLSKSFEHMHGSRLKTVFSEILVHMLHDIGKTAQAEVNHPQWAKAIETIYPKARDMATKPRYWPVAYPLSIISLCVAPRDYFLKHWQACLETSLSKLKERPLRVPVMNGILRLAWTYLYRCHEAGSTVTSRLDQLLKHFFPPNRLTVVPADERIEPLIYLVHFILSRNFDYGSELCLDLLQEKSLVGSQTSTINTYLAPDRMTIAVQAILLSIELLVKEEPAPAWPSSPDFTTVPDREVYPISADALPADLLKPNWAEFLGRCSEALCTVAEACYQNVGRMSVLDDQWSTARLNPSYEETHNYIIRHHSEGSIAYPVSMTPQINVLQLCYQAWPRFLHSNLRLDAALEMLVRGILHVEPQVCVQAAAALERFTADFESNSALLTCLSTILFASQSITSEGSGLHLMVDSLQLIKLWCRVVEKWTAHILGQRGDSFPAQEVERINSKLEDIEADALFMLTYMRRDVCVAGAKTIRLLNNIRSHMRIAPPFEPEDPTVDLTATSILLHRLNPEDLDDHDDFLHEVEQDRVRKWKETTTPDAVLDVADSKEPLDLNLWWKLVYPLAVRAMVDQRASVLPSFRDKLVAAAIRYHPFVVQLAGIGNRVPPRSASIGNRDTSRLLTDKAIVQQWHVWTRLLCITAQVTEVRTGPGTPARDHVRARSEWNVEREGFVSSRDLFRYLSPFLDTEHTVFRDAAVSSISSLPVYGYSQLLEDLSILASRQLYDDIRTKSNSLPNLGRARRQDRFYTAVTRIYYLTAPNVPNQRSSSKQTALTHILKFIRNMQSFLSSPENRDLYSLQRPRRYFCGVIERFFDGMALLADSDRFVPSGLHVALYRLCEEWCQFGKQSDDMKQRLIYMQTAAARSYQDPTAQAEAIQRFQVETKSLSNAAVGAMASLVHKAYFPPEVTASGSPTEKGSLEHTKPLEAVQILDRLSACLASFIDDVRNHGKRGLKSLLSHSRYDAVFSDEVVRRAFVTREGGTSNGLFFQVVADVICTSEHGFSFSQVVCLGLSNLCHPDVTMRRRSFDVLESIHEQRTGLISLSQYEPLAASHAPSAYLEAHREISSILSGEHPMESVHVLAQFSNWIPRIYDAVEDARPLILLQCLRDWVSNIDLLREDRSGLTRHGHTAMYHLIALTARYALRYPDPIMALWSGLVENEDQSNYHAVIRFLLEQSQKVGSTSFVSCAAKIIACLATSNVGLQVVHELCDIIIPAAMLPTLEHKFGIPDAEDLELWSDLDILFQDQPRLTLGIAQFSMLFLSEGPMARCMNLRDRLPTLLHVLLLHLDHRLPFIQQRCRHMLSELLRSSISAYDHLSERSAYPSRHALRAVVEQVEKSFESALTWADDDFDTKPPQHMQSLCAQLLTLFGPLVPALQSNWGAVALNWATACHFRPIACHSLQLYRALSPAPSQSNLDALLGRLSNIVADEDPSMHPFTTELMATLATMASAEELDVLLVPQLFWCSVACLSTTSEAEFQQALELLHSLLARLVLDDPSTADALLSERPPIWRGTASLQVPLLMGLRSAKTSPSTFKLLQRLAKVKDGRLIDASEGRLRDLYTAVLPYCLHAMSNELHDEALQEFAIHIGELAEEEERPSITRIMTSFAKNRFRTKEDFLRQSVASLREHYGMDHWSDVVTLLVGLVLNKERWLRVHTLQILKVLFQQRETKSSVDVMGSELLMPLLRLLETDLAQEALEVLEVPMQISGGPAAKHVIRMSLHNHLTASAREVESVAEIFGIAEDSGWCVPRPAARRESCRVNIGAVCDQHKTPSRPSQITFHEEDMLALAEQPHEEDLGDLVQNLYELSTFFQDDRHALAVPNRQLEARVAAILAKSTDPSMEVPQTPFADAFDTTTSSSSGFSDDDDDDDDGDGDLSSDEESDLFEFDLVKH